MRLISEIINESSSSKGEWCLWDYKENGVHEILVWKGDGKDKSDITEVDKEGFALMNRPFEEVISYCEDHKKDDVDKWHLDFSNANWNKIKDIF